PFQFQGLPSEARQTRPPASRSPLGGQSVSPALPLRRAGQKLLSPQRFFDFRARPAEEHAPRGRPPARSQAAVGRLAHDGPGRRPGPSPTARAAPAGSVDPAAPRQARGARPRAGLHRLARRRRRHRPGLPSCRPGAAAAARWRRPRPGEAGQAAAAGEHALTGVSGEAWARQRRAFQEAVAGGQGVQRQRHGGAARAAAALARQCASIGHVRDRRAGVGGRGRGARGGLPAAGGGRARGRRAGGRAPGLPRGQGPGRRGRERGAEPAGHIDALLHGFAGCVRARTEQVRAALSDPAAGSRDSAALLARLLQRTCDLQPEEVLDNAHSCLLAGFDTIMALVLCATPAARKAGAPGDGALGRARLDPSVC
ncbi:unnamed protein product, partial [Prorocentrum cordatum]